MQSCFATWFPAGHYIIFLAFDRIIFRIVFLRFCGAIAFRGMYVINQNSALVHGFNDERFFQYFHQIQIFADIIVGYFKFSQVNVLLACCTTVVVAVLLPMPLICVPGAAFVILEVIPSSERLKL